MSGVELGYSIDLLDLAGNRFKVQEMADRIAALGYARDAAVETATLALKLGQLDMWAEAVCRRLSPIWLAVDHDRSDDQIRAALREYRG